jgi:triphosphatase
MSTASKTVRKRDSDDAAGKASVRAASSMNVALTSALREFRRMVKRCRSQGDVESIHRLRIQSRRMVVWCDLLHSLDAGSGTQEARRCLKKLLRALARVRDAQVQRELLKKVPRRWTAAAGILIRELRRKEPRWARRVGERCRRVHPAEVAALLTGEQRVWNRLRLVEGGPGLEEAVWRWLRTLEAEARRRVRAVRATHPESLHRFRIAVKHLRYGLEEVSTCLPDVSRESLLRLRRLQARLGTIQDLDVCQHRLADVIAGDSGRADSLEPLRRWVLGRRDAAIKLLLQRPRAILPPAGRLRRAGRSVGRRPSAS